MDNEHVGFLVLLILLLQGFCFHIEMFLFLGFLPSVVAIDIEEIVIISICLLHKITYSLGLLPTNIDH